VRGIEDRAPANSAFAAGTSAGRADGADEGRVRSRLAFPGMHMSLHSSQLTFAATVNRPFGRSEPAVISVRKIASRS
jgi:hypothetical protein